MQKRVSGISAFFAHTAKSEVKIDFMKKTKAVTSIIIIFMVLTLVSCNTKSQNTDSSPDAPENTSDVSSPPLSPVPTNNPEDIGEPDKPDISPAPDGPTDGSTDGPTDGPTDGSTDGPTDGSTDGSTDGPTENTPDENTNSIAKLAQELIGIPFSMGGDTPGEGFDNSGFIFYVLNQNGINCPRRTRDQVLIGEQITDYADLKPGDLVFFSTDPESDVAQYGGIYIGGGKMIYSSSGAASVQESSITQGWYKETFVFGVSIG